MLSGENAPCCTQPRTARPFSAGPEPEAIQHRLQEGKTWPRRKNPQRKSPNAEPARLSNPNPSRPAAAVAAAERTPRRHRNRRTGLESAVTHSVRDPAENGSGERSLRLRAQCLAISAMGLRLRTFVLAMSQCGARDHFGRVRSHQRSQWMRFSLRNRMRNGAGRRPHPQARGPCFPR